MKFYSRQKIHHINKKFLSSSKIFLLKIIFKVALQYLFNVFILFNTVYLKLNFKLQTDPKVCNFKTWRKFLKPGKNLPKTFGNPGLMLYFLCKF